MEVFDEKQKTGEKKSGMLDFLKNYPIFKSIFFNPSRNF